MASHGETTCGTDGVCLGVTTFYAAVHPTYKCGTNGLPLTPNSIRILGLAVKTQRLRHPHLCQPVAAVRGAHERVFLVSECYKRNAAELLGADAVTPEKLAALLQQTLSAVASLHERGIVVRNLCVDHLLLTNADVVKLCNFTLFTISECGNSVNFPIGVPGYMSPELVAQGPRAMMSNPKEDVWALGVIALELFLGHRLWPDLRGEAAARDGGHGLLTRTLGVMNTSRVTGVGQARAGTKEAHLNYLRFFARNSPSAGRLDTMPDDLRCFLYACLSPLPADRPTAEELLNHDLFAAVVSLRWLAEPLLRCADLGSPGDDKVLKGIFSAGSGADKAPTTKHSMLHGRPLSDVYHLWTLAGGDVEQDLTRRGIITTKPPILTLPRLVIHGQPSSDAGRDDSYRYSASHSELDLSSLERRLSEGKLDPFPSILGGASATPAVGEADAEAAVEEAAALPLMIRERDIDYQFSRMVLVNRLLRGFPFTADQIRESAARDVPPEYRGKVWACLLEVDESGVRELYAGIDTDVPHPTDHQLAVDIPRCHQYDPLMSSPTGHERLRRVIKAWILHNPGLVYWQGLDSVTAPFLRLNFNDEALAFGCLHNFVQKFLTGFFLKDNSQVMQEHLAVFSHLLAYHDPELGYHLHEVGFMPDLFAIPWFLTAFAHVFPLDKMFHFWDTLILHSSSMTLCFGVAVLMQMRDTLLSYDFNECILHFGDAPELDVGRTTREAKILHDNSPPSITDRQFSLPPGSEVKLKVPPIAVLRSQLSPQMSVDNFIALYLTGPNRTPGKRRTSIVVALDIRTPAEFVAGHLASLCLSFPSELVFDEAGQLLPEYAQQLEQCRDLHVVVVANRGKGGAKFAADLVRLGTPRVSILTDGISALRINGLLTAKGSTAPPTPGTPHNPRRTAVSFS